MPIAATCPGCQAEFRLEDNLAGEKVRCQNCSTVFTVLTPAEPAAPTLPLLAPVAAPPETPTAPPDEPIVATLIAPPAEEVVRATLLAPPPAAEEEVIQATLAETPPAEQPKPAAMPAPPRKAPPRPTPTASALASLVALAAFLIAILVIGGGAAAWIALNLGPPIPAMTPVVANRDFQARDFIWRDKFKDAGKKDFWFDEDRFGKKDFWDKKPDDRFFVDKDRSKKEDKKAVFIQPAGDPLAVNVPGQMRANLGNGVKSYRVNLELNQRYQFIVAGDNFSPQLQLFDRDGVAASRQGVNNRVMLSYVARWQGEHTLSVSTWPPGAIGGGFDLHYGPVAFSEPMRIDLAATPEFSVPHSLRIQDIAPPNQPDVYGPARTYTLPVKTGVQYDFRITKADFNPVLLIPSRAIVIDGNANTKTLEYSYRSILTEDLTFIVTSRNNQLGNYTLSVAVEKPTPREVVFDFTDRYSRNDVLMDNDPAEGKLGHVKTYFIPMEAGMGYNIDQRSLAIDAFLTLYDPDGKIVAEDNNSGGNWNARILFDPKVSGKYKLLASDFKKNTGIFTIDIARTRLPTSNAVNLALNVEKRRQDDCDIVQATMPPLGSTAHGCVWALDGKAFFIADKLGVVHRYRYPELVEDRQLTTLGSPTELYASGQGLVAALAASKQLWIIDPQTLDLKRRLPQVGGVELLTGPESNFAFSKTNAITAKKVSTPGLVRHDLQDAKIFVHGNLPARNEFHTMTPDGRFLLSRDENSKLVRWRIDDRIVKAEETSVQRVIPWLATGHPFIVSPDSRYVAHPVQAKTPPENNDPQPSADITIKAGATHTHTSKAPIRLIQNPNRAIVNLRSDPKDLKRVFLDGVSAGRTQIVFFDIDGGKEAFEILVVDPGAPSTPSGQGLAGYRIADLAKPLFVADTGAFPSTVAFDKKTGLLCAWAKSKGLMLFDMDGKLVRTLSLDFGNQQGSDLWNLLPRPDGAALLGFTGAAFNPRVVLITLPKEMQSKNNKQQEKWK
jgi:predicted Zn finger-like uncharacterized protein